MLTTLSGHAIAANATTAQLQSEINARKAADTAEKNARTAADTILTTGLATEKNARQTADLAEATARQQAIQNAINTLQAQLNAIALPPPPADDVRPNGVLSLKLCPDSDTPQWEPCPYAIGDTGPAGGIVFYITDGGVHGLEAAPVDQGMAVWGCSGTPIAGADSHAVGAGDQNTRDILSGCNEAGSAAKVASAYSLNGYKDWFLPSVDELYVMWAGIGPAAPAPLTNAGGFIVASYWSSSEANGDYAWSWFGRGAGGGSEGGKTFRGYIRPVRAF